MDQRHLRLVTAVHRHGSLRRAAEALGLTQPTLSKTLARLEDELGVTLFYRSATGAKATPIGQYISERAALMIDEAERLKHEVKLLSEGEAGTVRIGVGPALRHAFLPDFAERVTRNHPNLRLELISDRRPHLMAGLRSGQFDLIVVTEGAGFDGTDWVLTDVLTDTLIAVAAPDHPLVKQAAISPDDFARYPSISQPQESAFATSRLLDLDGAEVDRSTFYIMNDLATILRLVRAGVATTIGLDHQLRPAIDAGELVRLALDWSRSVRIVAAMTRASALSPILRAIASEARRTATRL